MKKEKIIKTVSLTLALGLLLLSSMTSCNKKDEAIGAENYSATAAVISYEQLEDEFDGIIYRELLNFSRLIAKADNPLLVVFYNPQSELNTLIIPLLEELAIEYHGKLQILWIDANAEKKLSEDFGVDQLPQFTIVENAVMKRSLIGFSDQGSSELYELISSYVD